MAPRPVSNVHLPSGVAPLRQILDSSIAVALGYDGPASPNSQDLLETTRVAAVLAKVSNVDAAALSTPGPSALSRVAEPCSEG